MKLLTRCPECLSETKGQLCLANHTLRALSEVSGTPAFWFSQRQIKANIERLMTDLAGLSVNSRIFYACKANANRSILTTVSSCGVGIDVSSIGELRLAIAAEFDPTNILFTGPGKRPSELADACARGCLVSIDSVEELKYFLPIILGQRVQTVVIRLRRPYAPAALDKFGMAEREAVAAISALKRRRPDLSIGLEIHLGGQLLEPLAYSDLVKSVRSVVQAARVAWPDWKPAIVSVGGGIPIPYVHLAESRRGLDAVNDGDAFSPEFSYSHFIRALEPLVELTSCIAVEPGRCIVGNAAVLLASVIGSKTRPNGEKWRTLDVGFTTLMDTRTYDWFYELVDPTRIDTPHCSMYRICGPLCDEIDVFHEYGRRSLPHYRFLPPLMRTGMLLAFLDVGAYSLEQLSSYNSRQTPPVFQISDSDELELISNNAEICAAIAAQ